MRQLVVNRSEESKAKLASDIFAGAGFKGWMVVGAGS